MSLFDIVSEMPEEPEKKRKTKAESKKVREKPVSKPRSKKKRRIKLPVWMRKLELEQKNLVVGIDLSPNNTGVATHDNLISIRPSADVGKRWRRNQYVIDQIMAIIPPSCPLVVIEARISYGGGMRNANASMQQWGLHEMLLAELFKRHYKVLEVHPKTLKKFGTGDGNANKNAMIKAASEDLGSMVPDDNMADAYWLRMKGLYVINLRHGEVDVLFTSGPKGYLKGDDLESYRVSNAVDAVFSIRRE